MNAKLKKILMMFPEATFASISQDGELATVVSPIFEGLNEADRQAKIWGHLREHLPPDERYIIRFVFTDTPAEHQKDVA